MEEREDTDRRERVEKEDVHDPAEVRVEELGVVSEPEGGEDRSAVEGCKRDLRIYG